MKFEAVVTSVRFALRGMQHWAGRSCLLTLNARGSSQETLDHKDCPVCDRGFWMYESEASRRDHCATVMGNQVVKHPAVHLLAVCLWPLYLSVLVEMPARHEEQRIPKQDH